MTSLFRQIHRFKGGVQIDRINTASQLASNRQRHWIFIDQLAAALMIEFFVRQGFIKTDRLRRRRWSGVRIIIVIMVSRRFPMHRRGL